MQGLSFERTCKGCLNTWVLYRQAVTCVPMASECIRRLRNTLLKYLLWNISVASLGLGSRSHSTNAVAS